jgi:hypothetical protein
MGGFSFQRPACDIFVVGITQFPSTFYMMLVLLYGFDSHTQNVATLKSDHPVVVITLSNRMKYIACCGFILNAPLLPLYPILVQYTNWSLGCINTLLHTWLLMAWTCQGMSLRQIGLQMMSIYHEPSEFITSSLSHQPNGNSAVVLQQPLLLQPPPPQQSPMTDSS